MAISGIIDTDNLIFNYFDVKDYFKCELASKIISISINENLFIKKIKKYMSTREPFLEENINLGLDENFDYLDINAYVHIFSEACIDYNINLMEYFMDKYWSILNKNIGYIIYKIVENDQVESANWLYDKKFIFHNKRHDEYNYMFESIIHTGKTKFLDWYIKKNKSFYIYDIYYDDIDDSFGVVDYLVDESLEHAPDKSKLNVFEWLLTKSYITFCKYTSFDYEILVKCNNTAILDRFISIITKYCYNDEKQDKIMILDSVYKNIYYCARKNNNSNIIKWICNNCPINIDINYHTSTIKIIVLHHQHDKNNEFVKILRSRSPKHFM